MKCVIGAAIAIIAVAAPAMAPPVIAGAAPASACSATSGVTVIVDFTHFAGGRVERGCAPGTPANALAALHAAGFSSAGTAQYGSAFVCRIDGLPTPKQNACAVTPPPSAYWAYWNARPTDTKWTYSALGVLDYRPKPGSIEAFAFGSRAQPSVPPSAAIPTTTTTRSTPTTARPTATTAPPVTVAPVTVATALVGLSTTTTTSTRRPPQTTTTNTTRTTETSRPATSTSTSTTVGIVERSASGPIGDDGSGSPLGAILGIAIVGGLALGAFAFTRARRHRPA